MTPTCTNTIPARLGTPSHICGEPAIGYALDTYTHEQIVVCEKCARQYKDRGYTVFMKQGGA